jgi:hypothetical protein
VRSGNASAERLYGGKMVRPMVRESARERRKRGRSRGDAGLLHRVDTDGFQRWTPRTPARNCAVWRRNLRERGGGNGAERLGLRRVPLRGVVAVLGVREEVGSGAERRF